MRVIVFVLVALAAVNCTTKVFVVAPTVATTPTFTVEQGAYVESVATQLARPTETPVPPTSTPAPPTQPPVIIYVPAPTQAPAPPPPPAIPPSVADQAILSIEGTPGVSFSGLVSSQSGDIYVAGSTPKKMSVGADAGGIFGAVIQKEVQSGTITLTITCSGGSQETDSASEPYGVTVVSCYN